MHRFTLIWLALLITLPQHSLAASLSMTPSPASSGQVFSVEVHLEPEGDAINVIEGSIKIPEELTVERISTGGSAIALWPVSPTYSRESHSVSFTGGVAGTAGFASNEKALLFTLMLSASAPGTYPLSVESLEGFTADGTGTRVTVQTTSTPIAVGTTPVPALAIEDIRAPYALVAELGSDAALFDGKPFVSFYASDEISGVIGYEAKEGWFGTYIPVDRYYILENAQAASPVWIRAIDAEGNRTRVHVSGTGGLVYDGYRALPFMVLTFALLLLFVRYIRRRKV